MLELLDRSGTLDSSSLASGHFPPAFDHFRVEWERAAWDNAENAVIAAITAAIAGAIGGTCFHVWGMSSTIKPAGPVISTGPGAAGRFR